MEKGRKSNKQVFHHTNPHQKEGLGKCSREMLTAGKQRTALGGGGVGHGLVTPYKIIRLRQVSKELNTPPWIGLGYGEASSPNPSAKELITTSVFSRVHQHQLETKTF